MSNQRFQDWNLSFSHIRPQKIEYIRFRNKILYWSEIFFFRTLNLLSESVYFVMVPIFCRQLKVLFCLLKTLVQLETFCLKTQAKTQSFCFVLWNFMISCDLLQVPGDINTHWIPPALGHRALHTLPVIYKVHMWAGFLYPETQCCAAINCFDSRSSPM